MEAKTNGIRNGGPMNNTMDLINRRTSIRKFNDQPIPKEVMDEIIHSAMRAPTAGNMMMYSIIKVQNKETLKALSKSCDDQPFIADADTALIFVADMYKWHRYFMIQGVKEYAERTGRVYDGPCEADFMLAINDALIAAQNAVIAAESFEVGNCYIGDIMENIEYHRELLNLPKYIFPAAMLVFGNYDHQPKPTDRFDPQYVVFEETYREMKDEDIMDMFQSKEKYYNPETMKNFDNYAQVFYNRKIGAEFIEEMNRSIRIGLEEWVK